MKINVEYVLTEDQLKKLLYDSETLKKVGDLKTIEENVYKNLDTYKNFFINENDIIYGGYEIIIIEDNFKFCVNTFEGTFYFTTLEEAKKYIDDL